MCYFQANFLYNRHIENIKNNIEKILFSDQQRYIVYRFIIYSIAFKRGVVSVVLHETTSYIKLTYGSHELNKNWFR